MLVGVEDDAGDDMLFYEVDYVVVTFFEAVVQNGNASFQVEDAPGPLLVRKGTHLTAFDLLSQQRLVNIDLPIKPYILLDLLLKIVATCLPNQRPLSTVIHTIQLSHQMSPTLFYIQNNGLVQSQDIDTAHRPTPC